MSDRHPVFELADRFVDRLAELRPTLATQLGLPGRDGEWDDTSPAGVERLAAFLGEQRAALDSLRPAGDRWEQLAVRVLGEYIQLALDPIEHHDHERDLGHLQGLFPGLRETFDIMDTKTEQGWRNIATRLGTIGEPLAGLRACLENGMAAGRWAAQRQARSTIDQLRASVAPTGAFTLLVAKFAQSGVDDTGISDALRDGLDAAKAAVEDLATWLEQEYLPYAPEADGVGEERYRRHARSFLGTDLDLAETYRWGWDHLTELRAEMEVLADEIRPGVGLDGVVAGLATDPETLAGSQEEFRKLMLEREQAAMEELADTHFDIPEPIRALDVRLAPKGAALGAYFIAPSEDFSRPGTTWWSLGDKEQVPIWDEVTTAYHEGFPGHHLQIGLQVSLGDRLSRVHRLLYWLPGYGEGWALYAERLMRELGYFDRPEFVLGLLASNALRAVRVVIDIGSHLDLPIPGDVGFHPGGRWGFDLAVEALEHFAFLSHDLAVSEVTRYLGWPGQAIAYKVGERVILGLREEVKANEGAAFDLKAFHERVLGSGPVGLDHLREIVLN
jgi:uncharacterized protein (DUF885 family)